MGKLIIAGRELEDIGPQFKNWHETGWNAAIESCVQSSHPCSGPGAYAPDAKNKGARRYALRPGLRRERDPMRPDMGAVQKSIKKFVLHHDGVNSSKTCWNVLHNERGLSCHFLIDNDGTIYQTLDLALMGFHAAKYNIDSIGLEFCNRGDAKKDYDYYRRQGQPRTTKLCKINGHTYEAWDFTPAQYDAMKALAQLLVRHLPELPLEYPTEPGSSKPLWDTMGPIDALGDSIPATEFKGYIAHYHLTKRKWDPGPFNFQEFIDKLRGQRSFPLWMPGSKPAAGDRPLIPNERDPAVAADKIKKAAAAYTALNEGPSGTGGFFPVGPWGVTRLWHGGMHLPTDAGLPLHAPFAGRVVAARMVDDDGYLGSRSFVLLRHDVTLGKDSVRFYVLFMHVAREVSGSPDAPRWLASATRKELDPDFQVLGFDEAVEAGEVIGHVGEVGPDDLRRAQLHLEIFSVTAILKDYKTDWELADGELGGRLCELKKINELIDGKQNQGDADGRLSRKELLDFYTAGGSDEMRRFYTYHVAEWAPEPNWVEELTRNEHDFRKKTGRKGAANDIDDEDLGPIKDLVDQQIAPLTWWSEPVATALGLPTHGTVYHYHPIRFLEYINLRLLDTGDQAITASAAVSVESTGVTDDSSADKMLEDAKDLTPDDLHLTIEDLEKGWEGNRLPGTAPSGGGGGGTP